MGRFRCAIIFVIPSQTHRPPHSPTLSPCFYPASQNEILWKYPVDDTCPDVGSQFFNLDNVMIWKHFSTLLAFYLPVIGGFSSQMASDPDHEQADGQTVEMSMIWDAVTLVCRRCIVLDPILASSIITPDSGSHLWRLMAAWSTYCFRCTEFSRFAQ